jgi:hypothetical protein
VFLSRSEWAEGKGEGDAFGLVGVRWVEGRPDEEKEEVDGLIGEREGLALDVVEEVEGDLEEEVLLKMEVVGFEARVEGERRDVVGERDEREGLASLSA